MIIDPHIAVIRISREAGADFYDAVMARVEERAEQPAGVLMQFSAEREDDFMIGTAFRDQETMAEAFLRFTSIESQNEMISRGVPVDITRDQFQLDRLYVEPDVELRPFGPSPVDGIAAMTSEVVEIDLAEYHALADEVGNFRQPVPGRLAHLAYSDPDGKVRLFEFWRAREIGQAWYDQNANDIFDRMHPGALTPEVQSSSWLDIHSFMVTPELGGLTRHFERQASGPSAV